MVKAHKKKYLLIINTQYIIVSNQINYKTVMINMDILISILQNNN